MNCDSAFKSIACKGMIGISDLRAFLKNCNIFPVERELQLLFERFDKDEDGIVSYHEFVAGLTPFMNLSG
jgi:Ca2+-binding EF-hand superfamily protein